MSDYSVDMPYIDGYKNQRDWINFDRDNLFPQRLINMVGESPLQNSILGNKIKYICGAGIADYDASIFTPNLTEDWYSLIKKCVVDYVYTGAFAIQAILNEDGNKFSYFHQPVAQVRMGQYNDNNQIEKYFICADWRKGIRNKSIVEIKAFGIETPKKGEPYLIYFKEYKPDELYYAIPSWFSGANWILADIALSKYYLNYIKNNFSANLSINYPTEPTEEKKEELYEALQASFGGESNAGNILLLFGENGVAPTIQNIESVDADLYNSVTDVVLKYIVAANRLTSPILAGLATSAGFSSKSDEIIAAYTQYKLTVIDEDRNFIMDKINFLLQLNGYPRVLEIKDYDIRKEFEGQTASNDAVEAEVTDTDNNELKDADNAEK